MVAAPAVADARKRKNKVKIRKKKKRDMFKLTLLNIENFDNFSDIELKGIHIQKYKLIILKTLGISSLLKPKPTSMLPLSKVSIYTLVVVLLWSGSKIGSSMLWYPNVRENTDSKIKRFFLISSKRIREIVRKDI